MFKKDYIMRQFEEFGKVMAVLMGLKINKDWELFEAQLNEAVLKFSPYKLSYLEDLSVEKFKAELKGCENLTDEQIKILADLIYEQALYKAEQSSITLKANNLFEKALFLYELYNLNATNNQFNLDVHYKVAALKKLLEG